MPPSYKFWRRSIKRPLRLQKNSTTGLEEARLNLTTLLTSEVEASEPESYGGARPKTKSRAHVTSVNPSVLPQETVAKKYYSHYRAKQEQQLEDCAALPYQGMKYLMSSLGAL